MAVAPREAIPQLLRFSTVTTEHRLLVGNRLTLAGAIFYLLEWVGILAFGAGTAPTNPGTSPREVVAEYTQHANAIALLGGWLALVLLGRILFVAGLREGLFRSGARTLLADFALGAMVVSVALEIAAFAVAGATGHAATTGADQSTVVALDAVANWLDLSIWAPIGVSVLTGSLAMLGSRLFPAWLCWLGVAAGAAGCIDGVIAGAAAQVGGPLSRTADIASAVGALGSWIWMLVTAVLLFRASGRMRSRSDSTAGDFQTRTP